MDWGINDSYQYVPRGFNHGLYLKIIERKHSLRFQPEEHNEYPQRSSVLQVLVFRCC